jgi:uncharacterized delta-60 repeat protein
MTLALHRIRVRVLSALVVGAAGLSGGVSPVAAAPQVFRDNKATAAQLQPTVDAFRTALGGVNNGVGGSTTTGRREINWDGVPPAASSPNQMSGDFFNLNSPRGAVLRTPGNGFQVSGEPPLFGNFNAVYPTQFVSFSPQKLFTAVNSNITFVTFRVPGTNVPASVSGFGVVFTDVDVFGPTKLEFFDERGVQIGPVVDSTTAFVSPNGLSFVGVYFDAGERIARVRITSGSSLIDAAGVDNDAVAMDDFIYGEPQPTTLPTGLDTNYSVDGQTYASLGFLEIGLGMARQPDGKIVVVGSSEGRGGVGEADVMVVRYTVDGVADPAFNGGSTLAFGWNADLVGIDRGQAVAVQQDGKIVIAGNTDAGGGNLLNFGIARLMPDGTFDTTFDGDGKQVVDFNFDDRTFAVAVQPDGKIVVAGHSAADLAVVRLLPTGALDTTFNPLGSPTLENGNGRLRLDLGGTERIVAVAVDQDGSILLAGHGDNAGSQDMLVVRLTPGGALSASAFVPFDGTDAGDDLVLLPDGRIVLAGTSAAGSNFAVARLLPTLALDTTFNGTGRATVDFGGTDVLGGVTVQPDGRVVLAGYTSIGGGAPGTTNVALARLTAAGVPDTSFGTSGRDVANLGGNEQIRAVLLQPDGRIVVTGLGLTDDLLTARLIGGPPPAVTITTPTTNTSAASTSPFANLRGTAADPTGIVQVRWSTSRGFSGTATGATNWAADVPLLGGNNFVTITATNANGVVSSDTVSVPVTEFVYFLSEGATGAFFDLDILLANPTATAANVSISYLKPDGTTVPQTFTLGANTRRTVRVDDIAGLNDTAVSAVIRSTNGIPLVVERSMFWDATYYGGHTGNAVEAPGTQWLFAEGSQGFFDTYVLLANANATAAQATVTFLVEGAPNVTRVFDVPATSRLNVYAGLIPELVGRSFSIVVTATQPIIAERAMYFGARLFEGGHESAGVAEAATSWFHAEGATGDFFDTYILMGNPNPVPASVTMTFLTGDGLSIVRNKVIPASSRLTVFVDGEDAALAAAAVSTTVASDVPIISERAMYWSGTSDTWFEAHNSFGVTATSTKWALAEGRVGGPVGFGTFVLVANPAAVAADVRATFLRADGTTVVKTYTVQPTSRFNIWVNTDVPELANEEFGVIIEVLNGVNVAVERAMYWRSGGVDFAGGTNATAVRIP